MPRAAGGLEEMTTKNTKNAKRSAQNLGLEGAGTSWRSWWSWWSWWFKLRSRRVAASRISPPRTQSRRNRRLTAD